VALSPASSPPDDSVFLKWGPGMTPQVSLQQLLCKSPQVSLQPLSDHSGFSCVLSRTVHCQVSFSFRVVAPIDMETWESTVFSTRAPVSMMWGREPLSLSFQDVFFALMAVFLPKHVEQ
jgi:hypothetical protein